MEQDDPRFRITPLQQMAASTSGALITSCIVTPLDVVKTRLQAQQKALLSNKCYLYCNGLMDHLCPCNGNGQGPSSVAAMLKKPTHFNGTLDAFVKISRFEGPSTLWSGLGPTLILALPATVIYFVTYEQIRNRLRAYVAKPGDGLAQQPLWVAPVSGGMARVWAASIVSPLEMLRTRMQAQKMSYLEGGRALGNLMQQQGVTGLWKGLGATLLRDVPFSALYWLNYETLKSKFNQPVPTFQFSLLAGALSGSVAAIITLPFDVVKTHQQIELGEKQIYSNPPKTVNGRNSTMKVIKKIYSQSGVSGLFTGLVPRLVKVAPACAIMIATFEYGKKWFYEQNMAMFEMQKSKANLLIVKTGNNRNHVQ
ncbi:probable mitochondrial glutathione transporter SLC25A40 [Neocloeon triangulifer]|uniref:probable mitochondrial glutathione transporter SLC25A40 n=1 Tax=Neocloeon triangulifer TaxID=2078957 RepID=UPI00286EF6F9|nr:probable mitochondrial glutathione transporter SLC25A40 [Neocloeon triangulifer]